MEEYPGACTPQVTQTPAESYFQISDTATGKVLGWSDIKYHLEMAENQGLESQMWYWFTEYDEDPNSEYKYIANKLKGQLIDMEAVRYISNDLKFGCRDDYCQVTRGSKEIQ